MNTKYTPPAAELFIKNRAKFINKLLPKALAIFNSNDIYPVSADSTLPFAQHRDIFYLSGVDQEESILLLFPDAYNEEHREILFLKETSPELTIWEGEKLNKAQALVISGIQNVYWLADFEQIFYKLMAEATIIYFNINEHHRASHEVETREDRFIKSTIARFPLHERQRSNPILQKLRSVKELEEITLMQQACRITERGFRRVLQFIKPGVMEYEIEAEFAHEFLRNASKGFAYTPIIATGSNACVLHYTKNNSECKSEEIILMDVAAEYANYSSDMTRCVPVNGRFSARQKMIYKAVLHVKIEAEKLLTSGNNLADYHKEIGEIMTAQLIDLKLLDKTDVQNQDSKMPAYKKYFMHGTSHHLGLDTHDYGILSANFEKNMVFTIEPGIYIPTENIGIRLEDNYVVQNDGLPINLMQNIPLVIDEIEELMNSTR